MLRMANEPLSWRRRAPSCDAPVLAVWPRCAANGPCSTSEDPILFFWPWVRVVLAEEGSGGARTMEIGPIGNQNSIFWPLALAR